jgi:hypothetical protein
VSTLPFKNLPSRMIIELIHFLVLWLNAFPPSSGVSITYSPRTIMTGTTLDYNKHCRLPFGAYVETHEENDPTNTMAERTIGVICLGPTANFQGSYNFFPLDTGRRVTQNKFREIPMPASVIKRVAAFALRDTQAVELVFTDRNGNIFTDDTENEISGTGAHADEAASAGVDTSEHEISQHDEPPIIIMETEPKNHGPKLGPNTGAQLVATAGVPPYAILRNCRSAGGHSHRDSRSARRRHRDSRSARRRHPQRDPMSVKWHSRRSARGRHISVRRQNHRIARG